MVRTHWGLYYMYIVVAIKYTTHFSATWLFNYMALRAMCKYFTLLTFSLINHFLCLILRIQLLYSLVGNWLVQFHCVVIIICCFFFFHHPVLGGVLNLALSTVKTFQLCSNKSLDTLVCIHHFLQNDTVLFVIRLSGDIMLWELLCFPVYAFPMLSLFHVWFRFLFLVRVSSHWLVKQLFNCFVHYFLEFSYEFQSVSPSVDFWQTLFIFSIFLITCVILRWIFCHLLLTCFPSMFTWLSFHFMSLWWQASQGLLPCAQWNFFHLSWGLFLCTQWSFLHSPFFHYGACNIPDALCTCCLPSRSPYCPHIVSPCGCFPSKLPYCPHITSQCGRFSLYIFLLMAISRVFVCCHMLGHIHYMMSLMVIHQCHHCISEYVQDLLLIFHWHASQACFNVYCLVAHSVFREHSPKMCSS